MTDARPLSILILIAMGTIWGLQVAMLKLALDSGYPETQVMLYVLTLVALAYLVILVARGRLFINPATIYVVFRATEQR